MNKTKKKIAVAALIFAAVLITALCLVFFGAVPKEEISTYSMGSYVQQTVYGNTAKDAAAKAANAIASLEDLISWRKPESDIAKLNEEAGGNWVSVNKEVWDILSTALEVAEKSGGAFDPSIAPLSWLWNFDDSPTQPPEAEQINKFLPYVYYNKLKLSNEDPTGKQEGDAFALIQSQGYAVDLGAVGKGAACDIAAKVYEELKVDSAIISVGGSVGCIGIKPDKKPWSVAVRDPKGEGVLGSLQIQGGFLSTSGSYEKYFEYGEKSYHHLLDPNTGYPAQSGLVSVTVVGDSGALSDALSTACFVLGYEKSLPLLQAFGAEALFVEEDSSIRLTPGLKGKFELTAQAYILHE